MSEGAHQRNVDLAQLGPRIHRLEVVVDVRMGKVRQHGIGPDAFLIGGRDEGVEIVLLVRDLALILPLGMLLKFTWARPSPMTMWSSPMVRKIKPGLMRILQLVKIIDTHGILHLVQRPGRHLAGRQGALPEDLIHGGDVLLVHGTAGPDGLQTVVQHVQEELLALHITQAATAVVVLQFVQIGVIRPELGKMNTSSFPMAWP